LILAGIVGVASGPLFSAELGTPAPSDQGAAMPRRAQSATPDAPLFTLAGTIVSPTVRRALIARGASGDLERVAEGEKIEGWEFEKILADGVVLRRNTERVELKLRESLLAQAGATPPVAAAAAAAAPTPPEMTRVLEPAEAEALFFAAHGIKEDQ
jgi:hypothetical protein